MANCKYLARDDARIEAAEELRASKVDWAHILVKKSNQSGAATPLIARTFGGAVGDTSEDAPEEPPGHRAWVVGWRDARRGGAAEGQGTATEGQGTAIARGLRGKPARETRLATLETRVAGGEKIEKPDSAKAKPGRNPTRRRRNPGENDPINSTVYDSRFSFGTKLYPKLYPNCTPII